MFPYIPIDVKQSLLLQPATIAELTERMSKDPMMPHFLGIGPNGEGCHAMRVALKAEAEWITFSVVPPNRNELHQVIGLSVSGTPGAPFFRPEMVFFDSAKVDGNHMFIEPVALSMFVPEDPGGWYPIDLGLIMFHRPIELTFRLRSTHDTPCDVFMLVQRHWMPTVPRCGSAG